MGEEQPIKALFFINNAEDFVDDIEKAIIDIKTEVGPIVGKTFIVYHDAFYAFENRFGLKAIGAISDSDAVAPSPKRMAQIRDLVQSQNVKCVLAEPLFNSGLIIAVAGDAGVGEVDPMGAGMTLGPNLYEGLVRSIGQGLVDCLTD